MTKIVLDAESFKALASDTRLQILKALDARPLTVSELSRLLALNKATVFEHLKQLLAAELAKREEDPARKWVYYKLTWKGKNVLHPENAQIFLMLGLGALGLGAGILQTAFLLRQRFGSSGDTTIDPSPTTSIAEDSEKVQNAANAPEQSAPAGSGASSTTSAAAGDAARDGTGGGGAPPADPGSGDGAVGTVTSTQMVTMIAILVFLILVALLVWALWQDQARERAKARALIAQLPPDVNASESVS